METRTYTKDLKAKVKHNPSHNWWEWEIRAADGQLMAQGEEFTMKVAIQEARVCVFAARLWSSISRGQMTPSTDGMSWFSFRNTEAQLAKTKGKDRL